MNIDRQPRGGPVAIERRSAVGFKIEPGFRRKLAQVCSLSNLTFLLASSARYDQIAVVLGQLVRALAGFADFEVARLRDNTKSLRQRMTTVRDSQPVALTMDSIVQPSVDRSKASTRACLESARALVALVGTADALAVGKTFEAAGLFDTPA